MPNAFNTSQATPTMIESIAETKANIHGKDFENLLLLYVNSKYTNWKYNKAENTLTNETDRLKIKLIYLHKWMQMNP